MRESSKVVTRWSRWR